MTEEQILVIDLEKLTAPFPENALQQRQGGGGKLLTYVETHTVIHRLNDATGNCWDFKLTSLELTGDLWVAQGELTIPGLGTRSGIGVQKVTEKGGEDLVKGAASDCLKKCATLFGVALELYGPDYEAGEIRPAAAPYRPPAVPSNVRPQSPTPSGYSDLASEKQLNFMRGLAKELGWVKLGEDGQAHHDEDRMNAEVALIVPGKHYLELTGGREGEASKVIEEWKQLRDWTKTLPPVTGGDPPEGDEVTSYTDAWRKLREAGLWPEDFEKRVGKPKSAFKTPQELYRAGITAPPF